MIGVRHDYSWVESSFSFGATLILTILAVTSLALRYVTNPISCYLPLQFTTSLEKYTYQHCFQATNIFPVTTSAGPVEIPGQGVSTYHQWLPFFLGLCAMLCLLPHVTWRMLTTGFLWLDLHPLTATLFASQDGANRQVMLRDCALLLQVGFKGGNSTLAVAALGRKVLVCAMCCVQMLLMVLVFRPRLGGGEDGMDGEEEKSSWAVPALSQVNGSLPLPIQPFMCRFQVQQRSSYHNYEVKCFLNVGQVYTKGLILLQLTFLVLFISCILDLTVCALRLLMPNFKDATLTRYLALPSQSGARPDSCDPALQARFLDSLGMDGRWVLAVVLGQCGPLTAAHLTLHMMQVFKDSHHPSPTSPCGEADTIPLVTIRDGDGATQEEGKGECHHRMGMEGREAHVWP